MQADETLHLHPVRARLPTGSVVIGEHDLPDVVLMLRLVVSSMVDEARLILSCRSLGITRPLEHHDVLVDSLPADFQPRIAADVTHGHREVERVK